MILMNNTFVVWHQPDMVAPTAAVPVRHGALQPPLCLQQHVGHVHGARACARHNRLDGWHAQFATWPDMPWQIVRGCCLRWTAVCTAAAGISAVCQRCGHDRLAVSMVLGAGGGALAMMQVYNKQKRTCGRVPPRAVCPAVHRVHEARAVDGDIEEVCLLRIKRSVLTLQANSLNFC